MTPTRRQRRSTAEDAWGQISFLHLKKGRLSLIPKATFNKTPTDYLFALANSLLIHISWEKITTFHRWNGTSQEKDCSQNSQQQSPWKRFLAEQQWILVADPSKLPLSVSIKTPEKAVSMSGSHWRVLFSVLLWIFLSSPKDKSLIDFSLLFFHVFPPSLNYSRGWVLVLSILHPALSLYDVFKNHLPFDWCLSI